MEPEQNGYFADEILKYTSWKKTFLFISIDFVFIPFYGKWYTQQWDRIEDMTN